MARKPSDKQYYSARRRRMMAKAVQEELRARRMTEELVERRVVDNEGFRKAREVRDGVLNVPDRISGIVHAAKTIEEVHAILTKELVQCLEALTDETTTPHAGPSAARPRRTRPGHPPNAQRHRGSA